MGYLTKTAQCGVCWTEDDLGDLGRRIADSARSKLEASDKTWFYLPSFREAVEEAAIMWLKSILQHERQHSQRHVAHGDEHP